MKVLKGRGFIAAGQSEEGLDRRDRTTTRSQSCVFPTAYILEIEGRARWSLCRALPAQGEWSPV